MTPGLIVPNRVLLVSSDTAYAHHAAAALRASVVPTVVDTAGCLAVAEVTLLGGRFDGVLLDLSAVSGTSFAGPLTEALATIQRVSPRSVVVVLAGRERLDAALALVPPGVHEILLKDHAAGPLLAHVLARASQRLRLEELERLVRGAVSHDLRTALQTIGLACELIGGRCDEQVRALTAHALRANHRADLLVNDLADVTTSAFAGTMPLELTSTDLGRLASEAATAAAVDHAGRQFRARGPASAAVLDERRIAQLLALALAAAVRRTGPDTVLALVGSGGDTTVTLELHAPMVDRDLWAGAPLAGFLAYHIVHAHGGSMAVGSGRRDQAVLSLRLPRRPALDR